MRDTVGSESLRTPRGALVRATVLPGWGQAYNRQFVKIPFVYATLGGLTAAAIVLNDRYVLYRNAYQFKAYDELGNSAPNPKLQYESDYVRLMDRLGTTGLPAAAIRPTRDNLRRNRDLAIIGVVAVYGLTILDAYVSAHLADFDISEDLTVSLVPAPGGVGGHLRLSL